MFSFLIHQNKMNFFVKKAGKIQLHLKRKDKGLQNTISSNCSKDKEKSPDILEFEGFIDTQMRKTFHNPY